MDVNELLEAARSVMEHAHAPYSKFIVGAAVRSGTGKIYTGCNVENASYGLTICAERSAVFKMVSEGDRVIRDLLILGETEDFIRPCGACRQVTAEFSTDFTTVYMCNKYGEWESAAVHDLLPQRFYFEGRED
jgi:cytidine deaminase